MINKSKHNNLLTLPNGKLPYKLTNDYMFRAVFQKNQNALKGLLCALLGLPKDGILDFNLPGLTPEFYSEYKLMNVKTHEIYSDKFILRVLNLKSLDNDLIEKEPDELYFWARLFKATTWEELKMLAKKNSDIEDTVVTLHELTDDEKIKLQCEARERYERDMASAIEKGKREGLHEGENRILSLIQHLTEDGLADQIDKVIHDSSYREELYKEYGM